MTLVIRELERTDTRVLGALRCVDASTGAPVDAPLVVRAEGARLRRNRSGLLVVVHADGLEAHETAFDAAPATPALGSVQLDVTLDDPSGRYLPRIAAVALPRDASPANVAGLDSLFQPIVVPMYASSVAPPGVNWAVLRVSVREAASGDALGGALLIVSSGGAIVARGLSDWRGEALVPVPGVPVTTWSDDPDAVVVSEIAAQLDVVFDPAASLRTPAVTVRAGRPPSALPLVDPDAIERRRALLPSASRPVQLASGRTESLSVPLALP